MFSKAVFHPRIFRNAEKCETSTSFVGYKTSLPAATLARLAHTTGEKEKGILDCYKTVYII